jgi:signal peptidase I
MALLSLVIGFIKLLTTFQVVVSGGSMIPTFYDSETFYASAFDVNFGEGLKTGDIIVFSMPGLGAENFDYVKRIIGVPGDKVEIKEDSVYVNGKLLLEQYLRAGQRTRVENFDASIGGMILSSDGKGFVYNVPKDKYFVLGDNRENSIDSRSFVDVFVSKKDVKGKLVYLKFP